MKALVHQLMRRMTYKNKQIQTIILAGSLMASMSFYVHAGTTENEWQNYQNNATQQFEAGKYSQAMNNAQQALKLAEKGQGETAPYMASSLNMMAMIADAQGNTSQAIDYMQRAVKLFEKSTVTHENSATLMFNLARFYDKQNQMDQALQTLQRADQMMQSVSKQSQSQQQTVMLHNKILSEIQQILLKQNKATEAEQYAQRQYQLMTQTTTTKQTPQQNLTTIRSLIILLQSYQMQNNTEKANIVLDDISQRFSTVKTALKPELWQSDYADFLELAGRQQQEGEKKKEFHLQAIQFYQQLTPDVQKNYQSRLANHYNEMGFYYFEQKNFDEAENWFKKSDHLMQQAYGKNSVQYARLLTNLAQVKDAQTQLKIAVDYYQQAQNVYADLIKKPTNNVEKIETENLYLAYAQVLNNSAVLQFKLREYKQAEQLWDQGLDVSKQVVGDQSENLLPILENLVRLYRTQNRKSDESRVQYQINQIKKAS